MAESVIEIYDLPTLALLIGIVAPLLVFLVWLLFPKVVKGNGHRLAISSMSGTWVAGAVFLAYFLADEVPYALRLDWFSVGSHTFSLGFQIDAITASMLLVVWLVSGLVHLFSLEYMKEDPEKDRYFAFLGLFTFSMLSLVIVDNLLIMYVCWELVGISSFLLIGFWRKKESAAKAAKKAFLVNRIGDAGFLLAILCLYADFHTLRWTSLPGLMEYYAFQSDSWQLVAGLGLVIAAMAKSAQYPLSIWLPDAMEGPTPVSALIHAATMVAAGVYLLVRMSFLFTPEVETVLLIVGGITAFLAGYAALTQSDIKKVLAYSTVSQLGFMMVALGVGNPFAAFFHLLTHAFFKAALFLASGSVIHNLHLAAKKYNAHFDAQDMRMMGGLRHKLPFTLIIFIISGCALAGVPFTSGFLSKESIVTALWSSVNEGSLVSWAVFLMILLSIGFTAGYVFRMIHMTFFQANRLSQYHTFGRDIYQDVRESNWLVKFPLLLLAGLSFAWVFSSSILSVEGFHFPELQKVLGSENSDEHSYSLTVLSLVMVVGGGSFAFWKYRKSDGGWFVPSVFQNLSIHFFYTDAAYRWLTQKALIRVAAVFSRFDRKIDRFIDVLGKSTLVVGIIANWLDRNLIDGTIKLFYRSCGWMGALFQGWQSGRVQQHLLGFFVILFLLGAITYFSL